MTEWLKNLLPITLLPGLDLILYIEVAGPPDALFTVETLRLVCNWFGN